MFFKLCVPDTLESVDKVRVLEWHVAEGEWIEPGDLIVELETHKVVIEVRAGQTGLLRRRCCDEGAWSACGAVVGIFSETADGNEPEDAANLTSVAADFQIG